jgi:DNA-binding NtrC family response regulator
MRIFGMKFDDIVCKGDIMVSPPQVLVIAPESGERDKLQKILSAAGVHPYCYATWMEALSFLSGQPTSVVFADVELPDCDFRGVHEDVDRVQTGVPVIALTRDANWNSYLAAMGAGAFDCLTLPPNTQETQRVLRAALRAISTARGNEHVAA